MLEIVSDQKDEIRWILISQISVVSFVAVLLAIFLSGSVSTLYGGLLVMVSTWHVHKSIYNSGGDRMLLLKSAGLRFVIIMLVLGVAVVLLELQPLYLVVGMASAYIAMYARSLLIIYRKMKGDSLG